MFLVDGTVILGGARMAVEVIDIIVDVPDVRGVHRNDEIA